MEATAIMLIDVLRRFLRRGTSSSSSSSSSSSRRRRFFGGRSSSSSSSIELARVFLMGGGFALEDDWLVEYVSESVDSNWGILINVAHFGHFARLPAALSGTRISLPQPLQLINMSLPGEEE